MSALLTDDEHEVIEMAGALWKKLNELLEHGAGWQGDRLELIGHVHAIQHAVMANAAARAYPELYRVLGGDRPRG